MLGFVCGSVSGSGCCAEDVSIRLLAELGLINS